MTDTSATVTPVFTAPTPFDDRRIGAAAVYCSDGRYGDQMDEFLHASLGLPRYDRVAVPGGAGCLFHHTHAYAERTALERQLTFLVEAHQLSRVVLIAHQECGFYRDVFLGGKPLIEKQQEDLRWAAEKIRQWCPRVTIEAYFARKSNGRVAFDRWDLRRPGEI